jgi:hypothetical protein
MVLLGLQTLFGFQLIAVFNQRFAEALTPGEQQIHLLALALVAIAGALVTAPAAYHRQTDPHKDTESFVSLATRLLLAAMVPLILGIGLDFYLIAFIVLKNTGLSLILALLLVGVFVAAWFLLPRLRLLQRFVSGRE